MEEGLLLDRIALDAADIAPGYIERSSPVVPDFADPRLAVGDGAAMSAGVAAHAVAIEFLIEVSLANFLIDDLAQGWHKLYFTGWKCNTAPTRRRSAALKIRFTGPDLTGWRAGAGGSIRQPAAGRRAPGHGSCET